MQDRRHLRRDRRLLQLQRHLRRRLGSVDARTTTLAVSGFRLLFYDIPLSVLVFLAWSVGESFARERWGERLASFDALLRRDVRNATVGTSLLLGLLAAPAVAAATLLVPAGPFRAGAVWARLSPGSRRFGTPCRPS